MTGQIGVCMTLTHLVLTTDLLFSAIEGFPISTLIPTDVTTASSYEKQNKKRHILFTAETHNFPTGKSSLHVVLSCFYEGSEPFAIDFSVLARQTKV